MNRRAHSSMATTSSHTGSAGTAAPGYWYRRAVELLLLSSPTWLLLYVLQFSTGGSVEGPRIHSLMIALATGIGLGAGFLLFRDYRRLRSLRLRPLALGLWAAVLACAAHGLMSLLHNHPSHLCELFAAACRLQLAGAIFAALIIPSDDTPDPAAPADPSLFRGATVLLIANLATAAIGSTSSEAAAGLSALFDLAVLCLAVTGIAVTIARDQDRPGINTLASALVLFAQASATFLLSQPWQHAWWLGHGIFAVAFLLLAHGWLRGHLTAIRDGGSPGPGAAPIPGTGLYHRAPGPQPGGPCTTDARTSPGAIVNLAGLLLRAEAEVDRSRVTGAPLSVVAFALCHAERLRQRFPGEVMKAVEADFLSQLTQRLHPLDLLAVDPFGRVLLLLPETDAEAARQRAKAALESTDRPGRHPAWPQASWRAGIGRLGTDGVTAAEVLQVCQYRLTLALESRTEAVVSPPSDLSTLPCGSAPRLDK